MSYQKFIGVVRIATDLELRYSPTGTAITTFRVAFDAGYGDKKHTVFMGVVVFGKQAESANTYLSKGREVLIEAELTENSWEKDGQKHSRIEMVASKIKFLGHKKDDNQSQDSDSEPF